MEEVYLDMYRRCCKYDGHLSGIVAKVKYVGHSDILHREQFVSKKMSPELHEIFSDIIKIVNNIRHKALNSRLFESLCEEMGSQYTHLFHLEVRWPSRGKILTRLFALREKVKLFFQQQIKINPFLLFYMCIFLY